MPHASETRVSTKDGQNHKSRVCDQLDFAQEKVLAGATVNAEQEAKLNSGPEV